MRAQRMASIGSHPGARGARPLATRRERAPAQAPRVIAVLALLTLCQACSTPPNPINRYDFGTAAHPVAADPADSPAGARSGDLDLDIDVVAPAWLDTSAVVYRLDYVDASQVHVYAQSQWAAPPARLLEHLLHQHRTVARPCPAGRIGDPSAAGARLRVDLQAFSQDFSAPAASSVILRARARLLAPHTHALLAQQDFDLRAAAGSPDATGAVHGLRDLSFDFSDKLLSWAAGAVAASCAPAPPEQPGIR
jgi:cholesterol transport system auxiliary component